MTRILTFVLTNSTTEQVKEERKPEVHNLCTEGNIMKSSHGFVEEELEQFQHSTRNQTDGNSNSLSNPAAEFKMKQFDELGDVEHGLIAPEDAPVLNSVAVQSWTITEKTGFKSEQKCVTIVKYQGYLLNTLCSDSSLQVEKRVIGMARESLYEYELYNSTGDRSSCADEDPFVWGDNALHLVGDHSEVVKENVLRKYPGAGGESNFIIGVGSRASETESAEAEADAFLDVTEEGDKYLQCAKAIGMAMIEIKGSAQEPSENIFSECRQVASCDIAEISENEEQLNSCLRSDHDSLDICLTGRHVPDQIEDRLWEINEVAEEVKDAIRNHACRNGVTMTKNRD